MKNRAFPRAIKSAATLAILGCLAAFPLHSQAQTIIKIGGKSGLSKDQWMLDPEDASSVREGQLVMKASDPDAGAYAVSFVNTAAPIDQLNFLTHEVTITLTDLSMKGSAPAAEQVFILRLLAAKMGGGTTPAALAFRVAGDGDIILGENDSKGANDAPLWEMTARMPLKSVTLVVGPKGIKGTLVDGNGKTEKEIAWSDKRADWQHVSPYLSIETHRNPVAGDVEMTLGGLQVDAKPATPGK